MHSGCFLVGSAMPSLFLSLVLHSGGPLKEFQGGLNLSKHFSSA